LTVDDFYRFLLRQWNS